MEVQKLTHEVRLQHWSRIVSECRSSGKSIKTWCSEQHINLKTYYYWQKRICQAACRELSLTTTPGLSDLPVQSGPLFAELSMPSPVAGKPAITIQKKDLILHIYCGADQAVVETTLTALSRLC